LNVPDHLCEDWRLLSSGSVAGCCRPFVESRRGCRDGVAVDVKLLPFLGF